MDDRTKTRRLEEFRQVCRARGIPMTAQRRAILEVVLDLDCHPNAEQVYASPKVRRARISRATVYRTLESLVRLGLVSKTCHPGSAVRYDGRTDLHHHLICLRCDAVVDFDDARLDALPIPDTSAQGFEVSDCRVQLRGLCRRCRELEEER
jgi:Fe2+ or Zn2+ uptake regulation protein